MNFIDNQYTWKNQSLKQYLDEGNTPSMWKNFFDQPNIQSELIKISNYIEKEKKKDVDIYPSIENVFRLLYMINLNNIKIIIIGQDPYHSEDAATGISFDVGTKDHINPSLLNIYTELSLEGYTPNKNGRLLHWVKQGVFLINMALTVTEGKPNSHADVWKVFTTRLLTYIVMNRNNIVFLLFGRYAQILEPLIKENETHVVLKTSHPSPYSARYGTSDVPAFLGSGVFKKANELLVKFGSKAIEY
jgi:uracil-DNA glycosylase